MASSSAEEVRSTERNILKIVGLARLIRTPLLMGSCTGGLDNIASLLVLWLCHRIQRAFFS